MNAQGPAAKIPANGQLDGAFGRLLLLTENYPQLRSSEQFMRLQDELAGTENRIGVARKRYNDAIQDYNTFILQFPNNIWAGMAGFKENTAYFTASPARAHRAFRQILDLDCLGAKRPSLPGDGLFEWVRLCARRFYLKEAMALASSS